MVALAYVTVYVLTNNTISERKAKIAAVQTQIDAEHAAAPGSPTTSLHQARRSRDETVRQIATKRFDWHAALADLSKVVPANTSLQLLLGTVVARRVRQRLRRQRRRLGVGTGTLRSAINAPAFEMTGCTATQDDVAGSCPACASINGVQRVTLADSHKPDSAPRRRGRQRVLRHRQQRVPTNGPTFDLVIFFQPAAGSVGCNRRHRHDHHHDNHNDVDHHGGVDDTDGEHAEQRPAGRLHVREAPSELAARNDPARPHGPMVVISPRRSSAVAAVVQPKRRRPRSSASSSRAPRPSSQTRPAAGASGSAPALRASYTQLARLGEAVPADDNVPSLILQLQRRRHRHVDFRTLT